MYLRDTFGWPVTTFKGRPILNFVRYLLHVSPSKTWELRKRKKPEPWDRPQSNDVQCMENRNEVS